MKKITDKQIAEWYGLTYQTLGNYKRGAVEKKRMYKALRENYSLPDFHSKDIKDMSKEELFQMHEYSIDKMKSDIDSLQIINDFLYHKTTQPSHK